MKIKTEPIGNIPRPKYLADAWHASALCGTTPEKINAEIKGIVTAGCKLK